jgi:hypothetical protein
MCVFISSMYLSKTFFTSRIHRDINLSELYIGLDAKYALFLHNFDQILTFEKVVKYRIP